MELAAPATDPGATAWVLASTALGLLMVLGVAFYYGGMVRARNVLGILMQNFTALALVSVLWLLVGFSLVFSHGNPYFGGFDYLGLEDLAAPLAGASELRVPPMAYAGFQMMFAVLAVALVTGATADRWRFGPFIGFAALWTLIGYVPVAHWLFSSEGWAARLGALDFAGGIVVHANAGAAAIAMALVLGRRQGWPSASMRPHNMPLVLLGAGLLWFGWLGFTSGSSMRADSLASVALVNTIVAGAAASLTWITAERVRYGKPTTLGAVSGAIAGLVAVTACAGYVSPLGALVVGLAAGGACSLLVGLKTWIGIDDSLDVAAVHLGGGIIGSLCVGLFASRAVNPDGADGLFYGGGYGQIGLQALAVFAVAAYSFVVTYAIGAFLERLVGNRVSPRAEAIGLDLTEHGETAYQWETAEPPAVHSGPPRDDNEPVAGPPPAYPGGSPYDSLQQVGTPTYVDSSAEPQPSRVPPPPGFAPPHQPPGDHPPGQQSVGSVPPGMSAGGWPPGPSMPYGDGTMSR